MFPSLDRRLCLALPLALALGCVDSPPETSTDDRALALPGLCSPMSITYHVDDNAAIGGNGTASAPFRKISDALARARSVNLCTADVSIASGTYRENLWLDRATNLRGASRWSVFVEGYIYNPTAGTLRINRLTVRNAYWNGVYAVGGRTELDQVSIYNTYHAGVHQSGGTASLRNVSVYSINGASATRVPAGVKLLGVFEASLYNVYISSVEQGLVLDGGSFASADLLRVYRAGAASEHATDRCASWDHQGAIEVTGDSRLEATRITVANTSGIGINAHDGGGVQIDTLEMGSIETLCAQGVLTRPSGVVAADRGNVTASDVDISRMGCGVTVESLTGGSIALYNGTISSMLDGAVCWDNGPYRQRDVLHNITLSDVARAFYVISGLGDAVLPLPTPVCTEGCD